MHVACTQAHENHVARASARAPGLIRRAEARRTFSEEFSVRDLNSAEKRGLAKISKLQIADFTLQI
jgi:hypothetical protein